MPPLGVWCGGRGIYKTEDLRYTDTGPRTGGRIGVTNVKKGIAAVLLLAAVLCGCSAGPSASSAEGEGESRLTVVASTYPGYLLAKAVAEDVEGVSVERLNTGSVSCLHDYTLTVEDMKRIEGADVIVINGVGLEDFMSDALAGARGAVIDCSQGVELLESLGHDHHAGDEAEGGHYDPHIWMDPLNAAVMAENIAQGLIQADPDNELAYLSNLSRTGTFLYSWYGNLEALLNWDEGPEITGLITFHDGFQYFARAYGLPLLAAIEEEAGSEASAKEIVEITRLVQEKDIPVIFTEVNGSDATANAIARETGCAVAQLTMLMDGPEDGTLYDDYYAGLKDNVAAIVNGFAGEELQ